MPRFVPHPNVSLTLFETNREDPAAFQTATKSILKLCMGPYEANGVIRHRTQRLKGLQDALSSSGYSTELIRTAHLNRFSLVFYNREIYRCNIKNFQFNIPAEEDPVCQKVLKVLREHEERFCKDENIPKFAKVDHGMRFAKMEKFITTADKLEESNVQLIYEINDRTVEEVGDPKLAASVSNYKNYDKASVSFLENEDEQLRKERKINNDPRDSIISEDISLSNAEDQKQRMSAAVRLEIEESLIGHEDVFDRATKNARIRRASYMFKSGEIRSVDMMKSIGSITSFNNFKYDQPEIRNQKLILKVLQYKKRNTSKSSTATREMKPIAVTKSG